MEVLFTFLAERYERRSVMISSNLVFSQWDRIFKDPMTTAAAIDRIVHHAVILEMNGRSYRDDEAGARLGIAPPPVERDTSKSTVAPPPEKNAQPMNFLRERMFSPLPPRGEGADRARRVPSSRRLSAPQVIYSGGTCRVPSRSEGAVGAPKR